MWVCSTLSGSRTLIMCFGIAGISSGPPQVSEQAKLLQYTRGEGSGLGMFCQAQGFPVPSFR